MKTYNRKSAIEYARKWALGANPQYYHFSGIGGDCTNFISQCLLAGGGLMNYDRYYGWFYDSVLSRSPSWTSVEYLKRFLLRSGGVGPIGELSSINRLVEGDIIQLRQNPTHFNHTVIISRINRGRIYVCAHSNDALDKPLDEYFYNELQGIHIKGIEV